MKRKKPIVFSALLLVVAALAFLVFRGDRPVDFSAEVKPILNKHCIACHGGVKKSGGLSFLFEEEAFQTAESGKPAIIKGDAAHSEFILRLTSDDPEMRMPYDAAPLSAEEIDILTRWVDQGAKWGKHWAYVPPEDVKPPRPFSLATLFGGRPEGVSNNIDYFILDKFKEKGLSFSPEADKETLVRRLYMDIIGIPPSLEEVRAFLSDKRANAYELRVDSLLALPKYGEKWASWWLDIARYADSRGYERDPLREIWAYRDWVIKALNDDMPFDQFTIEQLAGDLLPEPTKDQMIATAFHRNTMTNDEGGADNEEFRVAAVLDRVNTTYQAWMSTTFECVQCHSHTYDPFTHEEYYQSVAFFNNTRDEDTAGDYPLLKLYGEEDERRIDSITNWLREVGKPELARSTDMFLKTLEPKYNADYVDERVDAALYDTKYLGVRPGGSVRLRNVKMDGKNEFYLKTSGWMGPDPNGKVEVRLDRLDGEVLAVTDFASAKHRSAIRSPMKLVDGTHDLYLLFKNPTLPKGRPVVMIDWFAFREGFPETPDGKSVAMQNTFMELVNKEPGSVPVMVENPEDMRRKTHLFERGSWLAPGVEVQPKVPGSLNPFPEGAPNNRLGMAQWIVSPDNPLTARTVANRVWAQVFGRGIVHPLGDMGSQSVTPVHQDLLDYLAYNLMHEKNWSLKQLIREMVLSATYRQSSDQSTKEAGKDPENIYLARGPRFRLSAEQVRDQALAASGLLSEKMYGPSVKPYQPDGLWESPHNNAKYILSEGEDLHRRALYTILRRTMPYASFITFDAGSREVCLVERLRTNSPLQALVTLNDPVYIEAAKHLAELMEKEGNGSVASAITAGYRRAMLRDPAAEKVEALEKLYEQAVANFAGKPADAAKFLGTELPAGAEQKTVAKAALMVVANALLNLDEFLAKS